MNSLTLAQTIATEAHRGQVDKGGKPYITHPAAVASMVETEEEKTAAWLHDVVEDTSVTLEDLRRHGFSERIVSAVDAVTRRKGEDRQAYLERVAENDIAINVKLADLRHNSDISRIPHVTEKDRERVSKYAEEIAYLESVKRK